MPQLKLRALLHALGVALYTFAVSAFMNNAEKIFGRMNNMLGPMAFLMVFVLSATITGSLVLGLPILLYLDNKKTEAVKMFLYTLGWLFVITVLLFASIFLMKLWI